LWPWQQALAGLGDRTNGGFFARDAGGTTVDPERFARFSAIADRLAVACARSPAMVVIDDVHAADAGTLLLGRFVARMLDRLPLVVVLTRRTGTGAAASTLPIWDIESEAMIVALGRFDLAETAEFLSSYGEPISDEDVLGALLRLTSGHPLHLQRVVALGRTSRVSRPGLDSVRAAIAEAVDQLSAPARRRLGIAALLGSPANLVEAAVVGGVPPPAMFAALGEALPAGLVTVDEVECFSFSHELVREILADRLTFAERTEAHARAAEMLAGPGPDRPVRLVRYAHHALRAAPRSADSARRAVSACRAAAQAMVGNFGYEQAAALLADAVAVHERAALADPLAPVLVEQAEAVLQCGRLAPARQLFDRAARAAETDHDPVLLARAALGLGGIWVNEHRSRLEWERVTGLQRRALAGLPAGEGRLRLRLVTRLAAEHIYHGGPVEPVLDAVEQARRLGDRRVLAEALSLCHHALLTPRHTRLRLALAEELIAVASPAGAGTLALLGLCWRTVDLFQLGDARAVSALAELRRRADAVGCLSILYIAEAIEVMLLIRAGRLDEAEAQANRCYRLGEEVGDADALGYLGAHLVTIRLLQGRDAEMLEAVEQVSDSPTLNPVEFGFKATSAWLAARAGQPDKARVIIDRLTGSGLAALPESSTWLAGMFAIVEAARVLDDVDLARQAYDLLTPYAELPIMPSLAVTCLGSVQRVLGLAALTFGDLDRAAEHLDEAVQANRLLGNRPFTVLTLVDLAEVLTRRRRAGDRERAVPLLTRAQAEANAMGMVTSSATCARRLDDLAEQKAMISRRLRHWIVSVGTGRATVPDRVGLRYLAQLLVNPGQQISALELAGASIATALAVTGGQPVMDEQARVAYRRRVAELTDEIADFGARGDDAGAGRAREELNALLRGLRRATGKGGRTRGFPDPNERARVAVRKAIKRAIEEITAAEPAIGEIFTATVSTGVRCCYTPDPMRPIHWIYTDDRGPRAQRPLLGAQAAPFRVGRP
jgi:tetratricopeptide (TPR) repeat protein